MVVYRIRIHIHRVTADIGFGGVIPVVVSAIAPHIVIAARICIVLVIQTNIIAGNDVIA